MPPNVDEMPVVNARPPHALLVDPKPERADKVQRCGGGGAKARNISRIRRYFRFDENDVKRPCQRGCAELRCAVGGAGHTLLYCIVAIRFRDGLALEVTVKPMGLVASLVSAVGLVSLGVAACGGAAASEFFEAPSSEITGDARGGGATADGGVDGGGGTRTVDAGGVPAPLVGCRPSVPADCKPKEYCKVAACAAAGGTCTARPEANGDPNAVCGCDNVSYWNESTAARDFATNIKSAGACPPASAVRCTAGGAAKCEGTRACNLEVPSQNSCGTVASFLGTCWGVPFPANCAAPAVGYAVCNQGNRCINPCNAIKDEKPFYSNAGCKP